jgi:hypothetical protein
MPRRIAFGETAERPARLDIWVCQQLWSLPWHGIKTFLTHAMVRWLHLKDARIPHMPLILILVILLLVFGGGGYYMGPGVGYYGGGGLSLVLLIVILFLLFGRGRTRL